MRKLTQRVLLASILALSATTFAGCDDSEEAKKDAGVAKKDDRKREKKVEIPAYEPTGDDAEMKKEGAKDITADNAMEKAKEIEAALDAEIGKAKAATK
ncbi:MAG: hypothetical protein GY822_10130 [Deltaproteobacteria bacterium]|nr:hypothetical protein [Deltaproteobacteria bacterium]